MLRAGLEIESELMLEGQTYGIICLGVDSAARMLKWVEKMKLQFIWELSKDRNGELTLVRGTHT